MPTGSPIGGTGKLYVPHMHCEAAPWLLTVEKPLLGQHRI